MAPRTRSNHAPSPPTQTSPPAPAPTPSTLKPHATILPLSSTSALPQLSLRMLEWTLFEGLTKVEALKRYNATTGATKPWTTPDAVSKHVRKCGARWYEEQGVVVPWALRTLEERRELRERGLWEGDFGFVHPRDLGGDGRGEGDGNGEVEVDGDEEDVAEEMQDDENEESVGQKTSSKAQTTNSRRTPSTRASRARSSTARPDTPHPDASIDSSSSVPSRQTTPGTNTPSSKEPTPAAKIAPARSHILILPLPHALRPNPVPTPSLPQPVKIALLTKHIAYLDACTEAYETGNSARADAIEQELDELEGQMDRDALRVFKKQVREVEEGSGCVSGLVRFGAQGVLRGWVGEMRAGRG